MIIYLHSFGKNSIQSVTQKEEYQTIFFFRTNDIKVSPIFIKTFQN
jgi:hypothetical protein